MKFRWELLFPDYESDYINASLNVSPWSGHRNFVYDLLHFLEPETIVELGTHYGCSFFAFCQAVKDLGLKTKIIGVDTWSGDEQAGFYGEEVFELVKQTITEYFPKVPLELKKMLFIDALKEFEDESIDIIHIDGLHTYDAVKEDFTTWLPKLKPNGVVLFHDIADYTGYGSHDYWKEIKKIYPYHFEFNHSWGLGVLFPKGLLIYDELIKNNIHDKMKIYEYYAELSLTKIKLIDNEQLAVERYSVIQSMDKMIKVRDEALAAQKEMLEERYYAIQSMEQMIKERDQALAAQKQMLEERYYAIQSMEQMIKERDEALAANRVLLEAQDVVIAKQGRLLDELTRDVQQQEVLLRERYSAIENMESMIIERDEAITTQNKMLEERYAAIIEMDLLVKDRDVLIRSQQSVIRDRDERVLELEGLVSELTVQKQLLQNKLRKIKKYIFWLRD